MTISDLNEVIKKIKTIYPFQDHKTEINLVQYFGTCIPKVELTTTDSATGAVVNVSMKVMHDAE